MELSAKTVKDIVVGWNVMFAGNKSQAELAFICGKFMQHLSPIYSDERFKIAAGLVEKEVNFFPTVKQIIEVRDSVNQIRDRQLADFSLKAIPEETGDLTEEEIAQNQKRIEIIRKQLAGKLSIEEAEKQQRALTTYAKGEK